MTPRPKWYGWWYSAIAAGFVALALNVWLRGDRGGFALRLLIAAGFAALAWMELRGRRRS